MTGRRALRTKKIEGGNEAKTCGFIRWKMKGKQKKGKSGLDKTSLFIASLMMLGWYILTFPISNDLINKIYNLNMLNGYASQTQTYSSDQIAEMMDASRKYNESIYEEQQKYMFRYRGSAATDETYESLPSGSETIGSLYIPKINVDIAIGHGTKDSMLQGEAGHLYGTSLPIDGQNVHAVIAGHSALSTAKLFTDLDKIEKGDTFYITVLDHQYEYTVDQIVVVLPTDEAQYEQIEEGKNYVTLYTCTPYGVNTHRLLVRGELTDTKEVDISSKFRNQYLPGIIKNSVLLALIILTPLLVVIIRRIWIEIRGRRRK